MLSLKSIGEDPALPLSSSWEDLCSDSHKALFSVYICVFLWHSSHLVCLSLYLFSSCYHDISRLKLRACPTPVWPPLNLYLNYICKDLIST